MERCKGAHTAATKPRAAWFAQSSPVVTPWDGCTHGSLEGSDSLTLWDAQRYVEYTGRLALSLAGITWQGLELGRAQQAATQALPDKRLGTPVTEETA